MKSSPRAVQFIKDHEGYRAEAYPDPGSADGTPLTIGYGHTSDKKYPVKKGQKVSRAQAHDMLVHDILQAEEAIDEHVKVPLNANQYGALVSFVFNVGVTAFKNSSVLTHLNNNDFPRAMKSLNLYVKNDGKVMPGLVRRRADETALFNTPPELQDKVVKQPHIPGVTVQTQEARETKGKVEKEVAPVPTEDKIVGGLGAVGLALAPILQWAGQLTPFITPTNALYVAGALGAGAIVYMLVRSYIRRQNA